MLRARLAALCLATAAAALCAGTTAAEAAGPAGASCPERYHRSFAAIRDGVFAGVGAAPAAGGTGAAPGDPALPGAFLLTPPAGRRSAAEQAALREANGLAKRRGAASGIGDAGGRWVAERVEADLADYLGQGPSPFLCDNVEFFTGMMRRQLAQISGGDPDAHAGNLAAQRTAADEAVRAALASLRPVPAPRFAPADRPAPPEAPLPAMAGLRDSDTALERDAALDPTVTHGIAHPSAGAPPAPAAAMGPVRPQPFGPFLDPDLPMLSRMQGAAPSLESEADRVAALDRLVSAAREGGHLGAFAPDAFGDAAAPALPRPVLARLAALKPLVIGPRIAVADGEARMRLVAAFSAIEALDYLALAPETGADPTLQALEDTMRAIEAAHDEACGCGPARTASAR